MRVDALLRLIVAMFFASLPLLLAMVRAARRRRARATEGTEHPPETRRRSRVARGFRNIGDGLKRALEMPPERGDQDLREPAPHPHRHRESFVPGEPRKAGRHQSNPQPEKPASTYRSQPRRKEDSDQHRRTRRTGAFPLRRGDRLTELQRAVVYQELLGPPRGLQPRDW